MLLFRWKLLQFLVVQWCIVLGTRAELTDTAIQSLCLPSYPEILDFNLESSLLSRLLVPRPPGSKTLVSLQGLLVAEFTKLGWHIETDTFTDSTPTGPVSFTNLIFTHNPRSARRLVLAAHLDSKYAPEGDPMVKFVGAIDSAAPVALLVDVARALDPLLDGLLLPVADETVQIVLFDGEEAFETWTNTDSIYGARHLAAKWAEPLVSPSATHPPQRSLSGISALVLLDLLGAPHARIPAFFHQTQWLYNKFAQTERRLLSLGLANSTFFMPSSIVGHIADDHLPFLVRGVPVVHIIPAPFPPVWHTLADDKSALDASVLRAWSLILRTTVADHLALVQRPGDEL